MKTLLLAAMLLLPAQALLAQNDKAATPQDSTQKSLPAGLGTLKQDEFTVGLRSGNLLIKVTPLSERVIRVAAPDTYNRLHALAESRRLGAAQRTGGSNPELFLVSFFSYQPDVTFQPQDLQIEYNGRMLRPGAIIPLTQGWGKERMDQQETEAAIYAFSDAMDLELPLVVHYDMDQSDLWTQIIPKLDTERSKILSRQPQ